MTGDCGCGDNIKKGMKATIPTKPKQVRDKKLFPKKGNPFIGDVL